MQKFYKIFLIIFLLFIGVNLYAVDWSIGFLDDENSKFLFSISCAIIGIILVLVMNTWSKLKTKKKY